MNQNPSSRSAGPPAAFRPYVSPDATIRELTVRGVVVGSLLGILFAASSVYLGLKVGLTVSASIPVAVLSITLFKWLAQAFKLPQATILENNIVQTTGSAGESIAAGVAFTLPSLLLMGFDMETTRILTVALLGGLIGVLMMIPLRQGLIVKEHGKLMYPEGTACADVLIVGEKGGTSAKTVFLGFFSGLAYSTMNLILKLWSDTATFAADFGGKLRGATLAFEVSPAMLGVGYIIGPKTAATMMAGGSLAFLVLIPLVRLFGDTAPEALFNATKRIADMSPGEIRNNYILYVGAGAVATGGFIALARAIPTIVGAFTRGLGSLKVGAGGASTVRTEQDLPMSVVAGGCIAIAIAIGAAPILGINALSAVLIILFGFFFVTVSSRITGEIGSSSNPISGMTVATLLITCGLFVALGWTGANYKAMALTAAALVCVAASNGGTISQDLKTGYLVGGTPRAQQIAIMVGVVTSAIVIGFTLQLLNRGSTTFRPVDFGGWTIAETSTQTMAGPDGAVGRVVYLREEARGTLRTEVAAVDSTSAATIVEEPFSVPRGKYLVDDAGRPTYLVDPGVCGTYPQRLERVEGAAAIAVPEGAPTELGADRLPYRRVTLEEAAGATAAGTYLVNEAGAPVYHVRPTSKFDAPKAQLFRLIIDGTLGGTLPWGLVLVGVFLAIMMELVGVSSLPFAVGLYLPISTSGGVFVGGIVRWLVDRKRGVAAGAAAEAEFSPGMLMASGLIAGGAIAGVLQSVIALREADAAFDLSGKIGGLGQNHNWWPMAVFVGLALALYLVGAEREKKG